MKMNELYRGGLVLLLGFIILKIGGVLFRLISMSMLPVGAYGEVAVFLVLFNWFTLFATFNITIGLAKFVSSSGGQAKRHYTVALLGAVLLSLAVSAILFAIAPVLADLINVGIGVVYWAIAALPFAAVYNVGIFYFRGTYRMRLSTLADAGMMTVRIALLSGLLIAGVYYAPFLSFVASFIAIDIYILLKNRKDMSYDRSRSAQDFRKLLIYSFPIFIGEFLRSFAFSLDRIVLSGFYSSTQAGFYDVAAALCLGYVVIASSYSNALLPKASASRERRKELFRALKASSVLFALYSVLLAVLGKPLVHAINPLYDGVFTFIYPLAGSYMITGFLMLMFFFANSTGRQKYAAYAGGVFAFLSLVLNLYLVPSMLYMGAVYALGASALAALMVIGVLLWRS